MKIKTKNLVNFLRKIQLSGGELITECVLDFAEEGIKVSASNPSAMSKVFGLLKKSSFMEYEAIGQVGVNELGNIIKVLDRFGEEITLKVEGNLLTVSTTGKKVEIELMDVKFITFDNREPKLEFTDFFNFPAEKLHEILNDIKLNEDAVITFKTEDKKLQISNTGKYKFSHEYMVPQCSGGVTVKMGAPFVDAVAELDGTIEFSIKTDYPIKMIEKNEWSIITLIVAPRVSNEE